MQVYKISPTDQYVGGCALVAAKSVEEAIKEFCKDDYYAFQYEDYTCTCNIIVGLDYDTESSCIIFNCLYES